MSSEERKHRSHLPIPTPERTGLITYDARDPDTKFPAIEQWRPPREPLQKPLASDGDIIRGEMDWHA